MTRLAAARGVIDAKHASFTEKPEQAERLPNMSLEALHQALKEMETPRSGVISAERRPALTLKNRHIEGVNDRARRFARKLVRYEQRAVNQIRKAARIKK